MRGKRYSEEQIIGIVKEHEAGMPAQEVVCKHGIANGRPAVLLCSAERRRLTSR